MTDERLTGRLATEGAVEITSSLVLVGLCLDKSRPFSTPLTHFLIPLPFPLPPLSLFSAILPAYLLLSLPTSAYVFPASLPAAEGFSLKGRKNWSLAFPSLYACLPTSSCLPAVHLHPLVLTLKGLNDSSLAFTMAFTSSARLSSCRMVALSKSSMCRKWVGEAGEVEEDGQAGVEKTYTQARKDTDMHACRNQCHARKRRDMVMGGSLQY